MRPGTLVVHPFLSEVRSDVITRRRACFCRPCLGREWDKCELAAYAGPWRRIQLDFSTHGVSQLVKADRKVAAQRAAEAAAAAQDAEERRLGEIAGLPDKTVLAVAAREMGGLDAGRGGLVLVSLLSGKGVAQQRTRWPAKDGDLVGEAASRRGERVGLSVETGDRYGFGHLLRPVKLEGGAASTSIFEATRHTVYFPLKLVRYHGLAMSEVAADVSGLKGLAAAAAAAAMRRHPELKGALRALSDDDRLRVFFPPAPPRPLAIDHDPAHDPPVEDSADSDSEWDEDDDMYDDDEDVDDEDF